MPEAKKVRRLRRGDRNFEHRFRALLNEKREISEDVDAIVADIVKSVIERGDDALEAYSRKFDNISYKDYPLRIDAGEVEEACNRCSAGRLEALDLAARRIEAFHRRQMPADDGFTDAAGVSLGQRWHAIAAAGLYVPGGTASYPSSVLMNAVPAKVAGVQRLVMTVPTPGGEVNPLVLAAARRAGVDEIYRVGGAQAVAALAYGTAAISPVDKIVGPGNAFVAAAKRRVFGKVGIDMIAGPSEILVVADRANDPRWIAADLLSQAEHDPSAQSILITDDVAFADAVEAAVDAHLTTLSRAQIAAESWSSYGAIIVVSDFNEALPLVDALAPEHLEVALDPPEPFADRITNAGAVFLGRYTPEAVGDYVAGTNHVLPTARTARFASGLSVFDFLRRTSYVKCDAGSLGKIGPAAVTLAEAEGLEAHALSVKIRLNR